MVKRSFDEDYNERLFDKPSLRSFFHNSRFNWFRKTVTEIKVQDLKLFELGCFDGRLLQYLPTKPKYYVGFDAGWENGLSDAQSKFSDQNLVFEKSVSPDDLRKFPDNYFDVSVAMETMEHLPPDLVDEYIAEISRITRSYFIVTVPNEKGPVFFIKYLVKRLVMEGTQPYSFSEFLNASLGRMHKIQQDDHKGFDYNKLISQIAGEFEIVKAEAIPFAYLPKSFGFTVGIVASKRSSS